MNGSGRGRVDIPPQPGPSVQETSFATASDSNLSVLPPSPIRDGQPGTYGATTPRLPSPQPSNPKPRDAPARALAPDLLRGLLMVLMAADHTALGLHSWPHETAIGGEAPASPVTEWNRPLAIVLRLLSHLCAPGFTFLLGMGVVYFGRSRSALGWTSGRMARHFLVRAVILTLVTMAMGFVFTGGEVWFLNVVLFALAVDYLIAGLVWMAISGTETRVALGLLKTGIVPERDSDDPSEPLLGRRRRDDIPPDRTIMRAADIAWHANNALLLALALVTIWWNIWLRPGHGRCAADDATSDTTSSIWWRIWFYDVVTPHITSKFPPMAWLSFALLGLLYGRAVLARTWATRTVNLANAAVGLLFAAVFVMTRLLHFGNLSEGCLHMPEHVAHPDANQYLTSPAAFFYLIKYPPDVAFWAFSMSANFLLLAVLGSVPRDMAVRVLHPLIVYGTSALFFYVVHIVLYVGLGSVLVEIWGHEVPYTTPMNPGPGRGLDQAWVFFVTWAVGLVLMYPLCRWYGSFKRGKGVDSIWRFF
ncbi:hypothetical protein QBC47DRAFT_376934 [Echria macrotheca]|uniref:Heparan-alpha-glucosaminide N-acetyltransferase catalytic domain-containing protein n=1 Tax=Echria macrotheca TaxID=438768 RepID=A0AAJ0BKX0_9PEZI|nr:hypothetical protein QBC47DRAFT_376934 [Echria macrotheca]